MSRNQEEMEENLGSSRTKIWGRWLPSYRRKVQQIGSLMSSMPSLFTRRYYRFTGGSRFSCRSVLKKIQHLHQPWHDSDVLTTNPSAACMKAGYIQMASSFILQKNLFRASTCFSEILYALRSHALKIRGSVSPNPERYRHQQRIFDNLGPCRKP